MKVVKTVAEMKTLSLAEIGFVPTMGALHAGHLHLVRTAKNLCRSVVVSIFVNPTQFNDPSDLDAYPRPLAHDLQLLEAEGVKAVFLPDPHEIYSDGYRFKVLETQDSQVLCGPKRQGHFEGVLAVVLKLLNIVQPTHAFFGEKDFQQLQLIKNMVRAFFLPVEIIACPTVREPDGLALSSRNIRLTIAERDLAPSLFRILKSAHNCESAQLELTQLGFKVEYVEEHWGRRFVAAYLGNVRLIDNVEL